MEPERKHLVIKNFGPISYCDIGLNQIMVFDGPQAEGKSTVAKAIFFFRTIKEDILEMLFSPKADPVLFLSAEYILRRKFRQMFGGFATLSDNFFLSFTYAPNVKIEVSRETAGAIQFYWSPNILDWLEKCTDRELTFKDSKNIYRELEYLFQDWNEVVYIPAGRCILSTLADQLGSIFVKFDDNQKSVIDYCSMNYIERILQIKPVFKAGLSQVYEDMNISDKSKVVSLIQEKMTKILKGRYSYINGKEFLSLFNRNGQAETYVEIGLASSGQQEVLWILNLIFYYLLEKRHACFIIEEPEAHLYPSSQKDIVEFIALAVASGNECIITTHSPYILGTLNNLLDAYRLNRAGYDVEGLLKKNALIPAQLLKQEDFSAYFVNQGKLQNAVDNKLGLIRNEMIDDASDAINGFADELFDIERGEKT